MRTMSRWRRTAIAAAVLMVSTTACGSGDTTDNGPDTDPPAGTEAPTETEGESEVVTLAMGFEPAQLNPSFGTATDGIIGAAFLEPFVALDDDLQVTTDGLATSWELVEPLRWRFAVREGVSFQNGEALDAAAVAFTIENMMAEPGVFNSFYRIIESVEVVDELTVDVITSAPTNAIPQTFASLWLVPPVYYESVGKDGFGAEPVGTGPFVLDEWRRGNEIIAVANADYWRGPPAAPGLRWTFASEASTRTSLLETGGAQIAQDIPVGQQDALVAAGFDVQRFSPTTLLRVQFSKESPPLDDRDLRVAAAQAIDRDAIVSSIFGGDGVGARATSGFFSDAYGLGDPPTSPDVEFNPDSARSIIGERGGSIPLNLYYTTGRWPADSEVGEAVAGMLESVGFDVQRIPMEPSEFISEKNTDTWSGAFIHATRVVFPHPSVFVGAYLLETSSSHYCINPEYDRLNAIGVGSQDPDEAADAYREIEQLTMIDDLCWYQLFEQVVAFGLTPGVSGFRPTRDELIDYFELRYIPQA